MAMTVLTTPVPTTPVPTYPVPTTPVPTYPVPTTPVVTTPVWISDSQRARGTVRPWTDHSVYVKQSWADKWTWVPYLEAVTADEASAPDVGQAEFIHWFGNIKRHDLPEYYVFLPLLVQAKYVMIIVHETYGDWPAWYGVIQHENDDLNGTVAYLQGKQAFTAFELSHLLDRNDICDAYTDAGWIDRAIGFNEAIGRGYSLEGNRSTDPDENGIYWFSSDGEYWSGAEAIDYILENHLRGGITWKLAGEGRGTLEDIVEEFDVRGQSPKRAIETLVDKRRGLGWRVIAFPEKDSPVYIYTYSTLGTPVQFGEIYLEANHNQVAIVLDGRIDTELEVSFTELERYDTIIARGELVRMCGTFSYEDETLEKAWTPEEESEYKIGSIKPTADDEDRDNNRQSDRLAAVYQKHRIPDDWDGKLGDGEGGKKYKALLPVSDDCFIDTTIEEEEEPDEGSEEQPTEGDDDNIAVIWLKGKRFLNDLPLEESGGVENAEPDYRKAFAVVKDEDDVYHFVHRIRGTDYAPAHVHMADRELAIYVRPAINHQYGLNHFLDTDPGSNFEPVLDYEQLIITANFETDTRLQAIVEVPGQYWSETGRIKTIDVKDAHAWLVMPNTVTDVQEGKLVKTELKYTVARLDSERLQTAAALAAAWYGTARSTAQGTFKYIAGECPVGSLMLGAIGRSGAVDIGTVITRRRWDFRRGTTSWATGFSEIEWVDKTS